MAYQVFQMVDINASHTDKRNTLEDIIAFWLGDTDLMKERWIAL